MDGPEKNSQIIRFAGTNIEMFSIAANSSCSIMQWGDGIARKGMVYSYNIITVVACGAEKVACNLQQGYTFIGTQVKRPVI